MITVYKYPVETKHPMYLPEGAEILKVAYQGEQLTLWAKVDTSNIDMPISLKIVPTGGHIPSREKLDYIDTVFQGPFVWHVFKVKE